jgi:dsRNA-specific ribonuclease
MSDTFIDKTIKDTSDSEDNSQELDEVTKTNNISDNIISDELVYNPFNSKNKEINMHEIITILSKYGIFTKPFNIELYKRAFIHRSYTKRPKLENEESNITIVEKPGDCLDLKSKSNERLEFIGDGVLECVIKYYLYKRFPKADEGFMTEKKIALVKNEHIGKLAYEMGLHNYFIISRHAEEKNIRTNFKKLGCLFESFIGAIFLDFNRIDIKDEFGWFSNIFNSGPGLQMAQIFIENIMENHVDWTNLIINDDNFKNKLQVIIQKEFKITPDYLEINSNPNDDINDKIYTMGVFISFGEHIHNVNISNAIDLNTLDSFKCIHEKLQKNDKLLIFLSKASHRIKKKAEQLACDSAITIINKFQK